MSTTTTKTVPNRSKVKFRNTMGQPVPCDNTRPENALRLVDEMGHFNVSQYNTHLGYRFDSCDDFEESLNHVFNQQRCNNNWLANLSQPHTQIYLKSVNAMIDAKIYQTIDLMNKVGFTTIMSCQESGINDSGDVWIEVANYEEFEKFVGNIGPMHRISPSTRGASFLFDEKEHIQLLKLLIEKHIGV